MNIEPSTCIYRNDLFLSAQHHFLLQNIYTCNFKTLVSGFLSCQRSLSNLGCVMDRNVHLHAVMTCFLLFSRGIGIGLDDMEVIIYNDMKGNKKGSSGH